MIDLIRERYGLSKDRLQTLIDGDTDKECYLTQVVLPSLKEHVTGEYHDVLWATALYYTYQEYPPDYYMLKPKEENPNKLQWDYATISRYLVLKFCIITFKKTMYIYRDGGFYENGGQVESELYHRLSHVGMGSRPLDTDKFKAIKDEVLSRVRTMSNAPEWPFNKRHDVIPVKNGAVTRKPWLKLLPQSPAWGLTYCLPVCYRQDQDTEPIRKFLSDITKSGESEYLIQIPAQALFQDRNYQMVYLLVGGGANGKSTYLNFLRSFIGNDNCTAIGLQELCNNKFARADLNGKLLNIYPDLPKKPVRNSGDFKALTGGDKGIKAEKKFCDSFTLENKAVMVFSANELPEVEDDSDGFFRRWTILQFPNRFSVNPSFECKLLTHDNYSAFLALVIRKMNEIELAGLKQTDTVDAVRENWRRRANPIYCYLQQYVVKDPKSSMIKTDLYVHYLNYCNEEAIPSENRQTFSNEVERFGGIDDRQGPKNARVRVWKGIRLITEHDQNIEQKQLGLGE